MSVNSSSNSSVHPSLDECFTSAAISLFTAYFSCSTLLLIPLFIFVLYVGDQQWRKQRSVATATTLSHSDIFTLNMVVLELIDVLGSITFLCGLYTRDPAVMETGLYISSINPTAQTLFHLLTCVERYLAVVHPVTYMGLKQSGGVRIRNVSIVCVWLLSFGLLGSPVYNIKFYTIHTFLLLAVSFAAVSFCSISVLCVLIRPGPGEVGGHMNRVDQSKQRAFYTILIITGALLLRFLSSLVSSGILSAQLSQSQTCVGIIATYWLILPSSLILPLLFLQRAGKLPGCKHNPESG